MSKRVVDNFSLCTLDVKVRISFCNNFVFVALGLTRKWSWIPRCILRYCYGDVFYRFSAPITCPRHHQQTSSLTSTHQQLKQLSRPHSRQVDINNYSYLEFKMHVKRDRNTNGIPLHYKCNTLAWIYRFSDIAWRLALMVDTIWCRHLWHAGFLVHL